MRWYDFSGEIERPERIDLEVWSAFSRLPTGCYWYFESLEKPPEIVKVFELGRERLEGLRGELRMMHIGDDGIWRLRGCYYGPITLPEGALR